MSALSMVRGNDCGRGLAHQPDLGDARLLKQTEHLVDATVVDAFVAAQQHRHFRVLLDERRNLFHQRLVVHLFTRALAEGQVHLALLVYHTSTGCFSSCSAFAADCGNWMSAPRFNIGAVTMKMINSTSITSMYGTMLISAILRRRRRLRCCSAMISPSSGSPQRARTS